MRGLFMRNLAPALLATFAMAAAAQTTTTAPKPATTTAKPAAAKSSTTTHRLTAHVPRTTMSDSKASEGLAAVGTMPAVAGTPAPLYALRYVDTKIGDGELARMSMPPSNVVFYTVHYTGWTLDGKKFDSSVDRGQPIVFPIGLKRVISGWDTGFEGMHVGGKRRLIVPYQLAYGAAGHPPDIPEKADLVFDIELVGQGNTQQPVTGSHFEPPTPEAAHPAPQPSASPAAKPAERPEEHPE
jgi:peptidylprolyl isomerase